MSDDADPQERARPIKLPLLRILAGAFTLPWRHFAAVSRASALPLLAIIAVTLIFRSVAFPNAAWEWSLYVVYALALCWLAIALHRLVLSDRGEAENGGERMLGRLGIFIAVFVAFVLVRTVITLGLMGVLLLLFATRLTDGAAPPPPVQFPIWMTAVTFAVIFWISGRFALMFPAIAVDRPPNPITAWRLSRGNGLKLAVIAALPWALERAVAFLWRENATPLEYGILIVLTACTTIITVVALSLSYWELTSPVPPPTHPPA